MRNGLLGAVSLALIGAPALAADMPVYTPPPRYVPPPIISWTGLFFGVNLGYTWGITPFIKPAQSTYELRVGTPLESRIAGATAVASSANLSAPTNAVTGGAQIGYDWQSGGMVVGAEADVQAFSKVNSRANSSLLLDIPASGGMQIGAFQQGSRSLNYLGTVRLRVGYLALPTLLIYATGGFAYGYVAGSYGISQAYFMAPSPNAFATWSGEKTYSKIATGWTAGFGTEYMIYPGVSVRGEYLFYNLGSVSTPMLAETAPVSVLAGPAWATFSRTYAKYSGHVFRLGLNIRFGDYGVLAAPVKGPVYARY